MSLYKYRPLLLLSLPFLSFPFLSFQTVSSAETSTLGRALVLRVRGSALFLSCAGMSLQVGWCVGLSGGEGFCDDGWVDGECCITKVNNGGRWESAVDGLKCAA
jgi:hypothetical protein